MSSQSLVWLILGLIGLADGLALPMLGMRLDWSLRWPLVLMMVILFALSKFCEARRSEQAAHYATALAQILLFGNVGTIFTYIVMAASPYPLADEAFTLADAALGIDRAAWCAWVQQHAPIHLVLSYAYCSLAPQALALCALLSYIDAKRVDEFLVAGIVAIIIVFPIMYLFPATGASSAFAGNIEPWRADLINLRSHTLVTLGEMNGIVSFPSYHTVLGILFICMARGRGWLFYPTLVLNSFMIASVVSEGTHYFVDLISGGAVAVIALAVAQFLLARCALARAFSPSMDSRQLLPNG